MKKKIHCPQFKQLFLVVFALIVSTCSQNQLRVQEAMDHIITRLYDTMDVAELAKLNDETIMALLSEEEKQVLATQHWTFEVNVPVVVSIMRHEEQKVVPFWLNPENGFQKSEMQVRNEEYTYEVWQKKFEAGRVELGINGFDKHRPHYFVAVAPQHPGNALQLSHFFPANQFIGIMEAGAFTYHDWDELVLTEVPDELKGQKLLTTIRGRARDAHLIQAFRQTPFPASENPDQVFLTWSKDPRTTQSIQWRTNTEVSDGVVRFREKSSAPSGVFQEVSAELQVLEDRLLQNDRFIHRFTAQLTNLKPASAYVYTVGSHIKNLWNGEAEFITAPDSIMPFSFIYFGDTHRSPHWGKLLQVAFERHPETAFYTIAGDLVGTGLHRDDWDHFFAYSAEVFSYKPLMPSLGNHDDQDGLGAAMYLNLFDLPKNGPQNMEQDRVYSFEYSNALFLILDATSPVKAQVDWLEQQLSATRATWKFAVFHFPPFMYESDYQDIRELWGGVFDKYHLDMAFSGHVHYYVRSKPMYRRQPVASPAQGTIYVTSVAIPASDDEQPEEKYTAVHFGGGMLYQKIDLNDNRLVYRVYDFSGNVKDELVIEK